MSVIRWNSLWLAGLLCLALQLHGDGLDIVNYYSPRNRERAVRQHTHYIVLHTTEARESSALNKLRANGEAHYFVARSGRIYRLVDKGRVAYHCGVSMWNGRTGIDKVSLGIEVSGYHNKNISAAQYTALKELLRQLQAIYNISDERVLTHSMVAYGKPNRWHKRSHRGRKRCAMLFAVHSVRSRLGLSKRPTHDPDMRAGRLADADPYLTGILYGKDRQQTQLTRSFLPAVSKSKAVAVAAGKDGVISTGVSAWDLVGPAYNSEQTTYVFPDGSIKRGHEISNWKSMPAGTHVLLNGRKPETSVSASTSAAPVGIAQKADKAWKDKTTIYIMPSGMVRRGDELTVKQLSDLPAKTKVLVGYVYGGYISARKSAFDICGPRWDDASTYYRFADGRIVPGNQISERGIPEKTLVFYCAN